MQTSGDGSAAVRWIAATRDQHLEEVARLCAVPSVSAVSASADDASRAVCDLLETRGFATEVLQTPGAPVVLGEIGAGPRTLLMYNHYDVQAVEPLELWDSPPFESDMRGGCFYARGAVDDKGPLVSRLAALDAYRETRGEPGFRLLFLIEGEEEIGSTHLEQVIEANAERLSAQGCIWETGGVDAAGRPHSALGMRGILSLALTVRTADYDVHSGDENQLPNAAWRLVWALASLKAPDETIGVPGILDGVAPATRRQRQLIEELPWDEQAVRRQYGVTAFAGGRTGREIPRGLLAPTCTINGLDAGYQGEGPKAVIPACASCKLEFRLVPGQKPETVVRRLRAHLDNNGFEDVAIELEGAWTEGAATDPDDPFVDLGSEALRAAYGVPPARRPWSGGSGPLHAFSQHLGTPIICVGLEHPGCRAHAPNENFRLDDWVACTDAVTRIFDAFDRAD